MTIIPREEVERVTALRHAYTNAATAVVGAAVDAGIEDENTAKTQFPELFEAVVSAGQAIGASFNFATYLEMCKKRLEEENNRKAEMEAK